ncbi:hypothetical protein QCA50_004150 [Cerrena zonata]|uniref:BTB domain-containing protein n=1 Tax=Cerrena zonata TaxID=2478898 RepID=A0AAW0GSJ7_9APHY
MSATVAPSSEPSANEELRRLTEPFQFDDADVILRAQGLEFLAHRFLLSHVSPVFKDMFSLPRDAQTSQEGRPVVDLTEDAQTIHDILSCLYPGIEDPHFESLPSLQAFLLAVRKYSMSKLQDRMAKPLEAKAQGDPVRVFIIACKAGLSQVARIAAKHTLTWEFVDLALCDIPELNQLHHSTIRKLLQYHHTCGSTVARTIRRHECPIALHWSPNVMTPQGQRVDCRQWWTNYIEHFAERSEYRPMQLNYKDVSLIESWCSPARPCSICGSSAVPHLIRLGESLEKEVEACIIGVDLPLDDDDFLI